jgi:hypothetical protein
MVSNLNQMLNQLKLVCNITMFQNLRLAKGKEKKIIFNRQRKNQRSTLIPLYRIYVRTLTKHSSTSLESRIHRFIISTVCIRVRKNLQLKWIKWQWPGRWEEPV